MKTYNVRIYNGSDMKLYDELIDATSENEALEIVLDKVVLYDGDTIKIELV